MSKVVLFVGPSGAGKSALKEMLLEREELVTFIPSLTTRGVRASDKDGHYIHVTNKEFEHEIQAGTLLEYSEHYPNYYYGTIRDSYYEAIGDGLIIVKDINVAGAISFKEELGSECITIFIAPPSKKELIKRVTKRDGSVSFDRIKEYEEEMEYASKCDFIVVNDKLELAYERVAYIIDTNCGDGLFCWKDLRQTY